MEIGNWILERAVQLEYLMAAVLLAGYWFHRAYKRYRGRLRYTQAQRQEIRGKARRSYTKAQEQEIRDKARRSL